MWSVQYRTFIMLGFSVLAPWNAVNVCLSYFANKYPTYNVNFLASIPAFVASAIFSYLYVIIQKHFKEKQRFYGSLSGLIIMMILFPIMANSLPNSDLGFWIFLVLCFLANSFTTILQCASYGMAASYGFQRVIDFNTGTGLNGTVFSLIRIFYLSIYDQQEIQDQFISILLYFITTIIFLLYTLKCLRENFQFKPLFQQLVQNIEINEQMNVEEKQTNFDWNLNKLMLIKTWIPTLLMVLTLIQTFMVFPGLLISKSIYDLNQDWTCAILITIFNFCDMIGKYSSKFKLSLKLLILIVFLRNLLVVYYFNYYLSPKTSQFSQKESFLITVTTFFSFLNGYLSSQLSAQISDQAETEQQAYSCGFIIGACFNIGCIIGAVISIICFT